MGAGVRPTVARGVEVAGGVAECVLSDGAIPRYCRHLSRPTMSIADVSATNVFAGMDPLEGSVESTVRMSTLFIGLLDVGRRVGGRDSPDAAGPADGFKSMSVPRLGGCAGIRGSPPAPS